MKVIYDVNDSVKVITDDDGQIVSQMEYLPYGETWFQEGDQKHSPKYNSQELDKETNFYFYNARHYDPEIGRFVTPDTVVPYKESTQSWNRMSYVRNNPILFKDPTGHVDVLERLYNGATGKGFVTDETLEWGKTQENNIMSNFQNDTRLTTEKKVAEMEAKGLKTDRLQKRLTDLRRKYNCNRSLTTPERTALDQYKESLVNRSPVSSDAVKPIEGSYISKGGGYKVGHKALDISNGKVGASVVAAKSGEVYDIRYQAGYYDKNGIAKPGAGRYVITKNDDNTYSYYMHLVKDSTKLQKGQAIKAGETQIGKMGNTGSETLTAKMKAHLHYEERNPDWSYRRPTEVESLYKK